MRRFLAFSLLVSLGAPAFGLSGAQVAFEPNRGRWPEAQRFGARLDGVQAWFGAGGITLALQRSEHEATALRLGFDALPPTGEDERCRTLIDFRGDPARPRVTEHVFGRVRFAEVAPGCDLVVRADDGAFEYDLEVASGAELDGFEVRCEGVETLWLAPDGALVIETPVGALIQPLPSAWQLRRGRREALAARYRLTGPRSYALELVGRDRDLACVVDPALRWSTYLTGSSEQTVTDIVPGPAGAAIVCGYTLSTDFPTTLGSFDPFYSGALDAFVSRVSNDGTQLDWSAFLGGSGDDRALSLALAPGGEVVVGGETASSDFPTVSAYDASLGGVQDVFLARIAADGSALVWSTFLGGSSSERFGELALDAAGDVVAVGATRGGGFPTTPGALDTSYNGGASLGDAFVTKLRADGSALVWSTFLGSSADERGERVTLDATGAVTLAGTALGAGFPTTPAAFDRLWQAPSEAFVARLDAGGAQLVWSTFLGGSGAESVRALLVRPTGAVLCVGTTLAADFPLSQPALDDHFAGHSEGFVAELADDGSQLLTSTFIGGAGDDEVVGVAIEAGGSVLIGGSTSSADYPTTPGAFDRSYHAFVNGSSFDVFVTRLEGDLGARKYSTFLGSNYDDVLGALALDAAGAVLLGGTTRGAGFPTSLGAFQPDWNVTATTEGFVSRLELLLHPIPYGTPKVNSSTSIAPIRWNGFPSVVEADFRVGVDFALPNAWCQVFYGVAPADRPFVGGRLYVQPPFARSPRFKSDFLGYGERLIPLEPWMAGRTLYFQVYYVDSGDPFGASLSDGLRVIVYP